MYLDSGATSQRPNQVIDAEADFYATTTRTRTAALYQLGEEATELFEGARAKLAVVHRRARARDHGVHARHHRVHEPRRARLGAHVPAARATRSCITEMEHHSNIVPWQMAARATGAVLRYIPLTDDGMLDLSDLELAAHRAHEDALASPACRTPSAPSRRSEQLIEAAHAVGALVAVDGAQLVPHHRSTSPRSTATSWRSAGTRCSGRRPRAVCTRSASILEAMEPMFGGGEMIREVFHDHATWNDVPVQVRGRHDADRPADRAGRGDRLPRGAGHGRGPRARGGHHRATRSTGCIDCGATVFGPKDIGRSRRRGELLVQGGPPARPGARS